jgi:hypothetical protein
LNYAEFLPAWFQASGARLVVALPNPVTCLNEWTIAVLGVEMSWNLSQDGGVPQLFGLFLADSSGCS